MNGVIDSQRGEIYRAHQGDDNNIDEIKQFLHEQFLEQNRDLREAHEKSLNEMEEMKRFEGFNIRYNFDEKIGRRSRHYP